MNFCFTFDHSETDEENWETQKDQFNEEAAGEENAESDEENNLLTGIIWAKVQYSQLPFNLFSLN